MAHRIWCLQISGQIIVFVGFPSESSWRYINDINGLYSFHPCVCFAEVVSTNNDYIICQSDYRIYEIEFSDKLLLADDPTGMSGGAAFILHRKGKGLTCSFIGIVSDGKFIEKNCLTTYIKLAKRLNSDGTIKEAIE